MGSNPVKTCRYCKRVKPRTTEYFHRHPSTKDGFANRCKKCVRAYQKEHYGSGYAKKRLQRSKTKWAKGQRKAKRLEKEEKISDFLRLMERQGHRVLMRNISIHGTTTLVRMLYRDGSVRTIYFSWKGNQLDRRETSGLSREEKKLQKRIKAKGHI